MAGDNVPSKSCPRPASAFTLANIPMVQQKGEGFCDVVERLVHVRYLVLVSECNRIYWLRLGCLIPAQDKYYYGVYSLCCACQRSWLSSTHAWRIKQLLSSPKMNHGSTNPSVVNVISRCLLPYPRVFWHTTDPCASVNDVITSLLAQKPHSWVKEKVAYLKWDSDFQMDILH